MDDLYDSADGRRGGGGLCVAVGVDFIHALYHWSINFVYVIDIS